LSIITRTISRPFHVYDIPVPSNLRLQFVYNFFKSDERISTSTIDESSPQKTYARAFKLEWSPLGISEFMGDRSTGVETSVLTEQQRSLLKKISNDPFGQVNEVNVRTRNSSLKLIQDINFDIRVGERLKESVILRNRDFSTGSASDIAKYAKQIMGDSFEQSWLDIPSLNPPSYENLLRGTAATDSDSNDESFQILIDNERARAAFREFEGSPSAKASYSAFDSLRSIFESTNDAPERRDSDPEFIGEPDNEGNSIASAPVLLGYMIEKISSDSIDDKPIRIVVPRGKTSYLDREIKYGQIYSYRVRSIVAVYTDPTVENGRFSEVVISMIPFLSNPTKSVTLVAEESLPPPPPADFNFHWDYQDSTMKMLWSFPSNPQRDIKYWQIFRRNSINDPYSLVRMIDFDDSAVLSKFPETIDPALISKYQSSVNYYVDPEFNKDTDYIYTMCSVDAHGQSSNYGMQFRVRFDKRKNKLIKELISPSGASKQYPNTYLNAELTLDSVKSSGATKMRIYFDPEYLVVKNSDDNDVHFLRTSPAGLYQIQLINVDRQKQSDISISINDPDGRVSEISPST